MRVISDLADLGASAITLADLRHPARADVELAVQEASAQHAIARPARLEPDPAVPLPGDLFSAPIFYTFPVYYVRLRHGFVCPGWGAVFTRSGDLVGDSVNAARWASPTLLDLPGVIGTPGDLRFDPSASVATLPGRHVLLNNWGSHNYGHFILECLTGLLPILSLIGRGGWTVLAKPLHPWQRELLGLLGIGPDAIREEAAHLCACEELLFPSPLGGNLEMPTILTRALLDVLRIAAGRRSSGRPERRILIDRSGYPARRALNWQEIRAACEQEGYEAVRTETLSVTEQIRLFAEARAVVGETGAALTNAGFCDRTAMVAEIMVKGRESGWMRNTTSLLGLEWRCLYADSTATEAGLDYTVDVGRLRRLLA